MPHKRITMEEIARDLGVSKTTVSRALSGRGRISTETRERINEYIRRSGCHLRTSGEALPTHNLALVIPSHFVQLDLPFMRKCMGGICRMAAQRDYDILLCYADENHTEQLERQLAAHKVDGVILTRTLNHDPCLELVRKYQIPFSVVGRHDDPDVLQADNHQVLAATEMTRYLLRLGMKRIAYMGGSLNYTVNVDRLAGFRQAMIESDTPILEGLVYSDIESDEKRMDDLEAILEQKPQCILCCDDSMAANVLKELQRRGIRVPEQLRLASLYDSELLLQLSPSISAVQFDPTALGAAACRLLLDHMSGKHTHTRIVQAHQLVIRDSTK